MSWTKHYILSRFYVSIMRNYVLFVFNFNLILVVLLKYNKNKLSWHGERLVPEVVKVGYGNSDSQSRGLGFERTGVLEERGSRGQGF